MSSRIASDIYRNTADNANTRELRQVPSPQHLKMKHVSRRGGELHLVSGTAIDERIHARPSPRGLTRVDSFGAHSIPDPEGCFERMMNRSASANRPFIGAAIDRQVDVPAIVDERVKVHHPWSTTAQAGRDCGTAK